MKYTYEPPKDDGPKHVTIASIVKNAEDMLPTALNCWTSMADRVMVMDNGSTDTTRDILSSTKVEWTTHDVPMDGAESQARQALWDWASADADWLVILDSDHVVAKDFRPYLRGRHVQFWVYDMWGEKTFRDDKWWRPRPWWSAVRLSGPKQDYVFSPRGWHCGHLPQNGNFGQATKLPRECAILHYGYSTPERRERHFDAYMSRRHVLSPLEVYHARTILDPAPNIVPLDIETGWTL